MKITISSNYSIQRKCFIQKWQQHRVIRSISCIFNVGFYVYATGFIWLWRCDLSSSFDIKERKTAWFYFLWFPILWNKYIRSILWSYAFQKLEFFFLSAQTQTNAWNDKTGEVQWITLILKKVSTYLRLLTPFFAVGIQTLLKVAVISVFSFLRTFRAIKCEAICEMCRCLTAYFSRSSGF